MKEHHNTIDQIRYWIKRLLIGCLYVITEKERLKENEMEESYDVVLVIRQSFCFSTSFRSFQIVSKSMKIKNRWKMKRKQIKSIHFNFFPVSLSFYSFNWTMKSIENPINFTINFHLSNKHRFHFICRPIWIDHNFYLDHSTCPSNHCFSVIPW